MGYCSLTPDRKDEPDTEGQGADGPNANTSPPPEAPQ